MEVIRFLFNKIISCLNLKLDVLGYDISIMEVFMFVVIGSVLLALLYFMWDR